jgi:probable rRNA maturation factor
MSHLIDVDTDGVRLPLSRQRVIDLACGVLKSERVRDARLSITFVSTRRIAALNKEHLGHQGPTDVISFALASGSGSAPLAGDIYIAPDIARRNATDNEVSVREELSRLVIHGALHVVGFDHPAGEGREQSPMWRRQEELLRALTAARGRPRRTRSAA